MLTDEQRNVIEAIKSGSNVFITGPGGVGKSTIIRDLENVAITAMTGAAAVLIGGRTLHSYMGIGLGKENEKDLFYKVSSKASVAKTWKDLKTLVIDEVSMLPAKLLDKLEYVARRIRSSSAPFGGIQLILVGDFLQLPCIDGEFCFESQCWESLNFTVFNLLEIQRQVDITFQKVLNKARFGEITEADIKYLMSNTEFPDDGIAPTRILCTNVDVDRINAKELAKLPADETFTFQIEIDQQPGSNYRIYPKNHCNAVESLTLAVGAVVMLLVNTNQSSGLINGSIGTVVRFDNDGIPIVRFINGIVMTVGYHTWEVRENKILRGKIHAIPLRLAYAITCHKSQGATIDRAIIELKDVFDFGQAYVAISRVKSIESLILKNAISDSFKAHPKALKFYSSLASHLPEN